MATLLVLMLIWSFSSLFVVGKSFEQSDLVNDRLHGALATIFEYQSRYDGVYEQAYPKIHHKLNEKNQELATRQNAQKSEKSSQAHPASATQETIPLINQTINFSPESLANHQPSQDWPIVVEDVAFRQEQRDMELSFAIRNSKSPDKADGYIWSVLSLQDRDGKITYIGSPSGIKIDEKGDLIKPGKGANWYSIRYYKAKSFYFRLGEQQRGKVKEILIGMMDLTGNKSFIRLPVPDNSADPDSGKNVRPGHASIKKK